MSDGVIAPGYEPEALEILKSKRKGGYNIVEIDPEYIPDPTERKQVFGITFEQGRNNFKIDFSLLSDIVTKNKELPENAKIDLLIALITLKYTQSNSVCYAKDGQAIGVGGAVVECLKANLTVQSRCFFINLSYLSGHSSYTPGSEIHNRA